MKPPVIQGRVIGALQLAPDTALSVIAKSLGIRSHSARYALDRARKTGLVERRYFINLFRLGYQQHEIFFSLSSEKRNDRKRLMSELTQHRAVSWMGTFGGEFQYGINICVKHQRDLINFLRTLSERYGQIFLEKQFAQRVSLVFYGNRYLLPRRGKQKTLEYSLDVTPSTIDEVDNNILRHITQFGESSTYDTARALGLPKSTVDYRMRGLRAAGIIVGSYLSVRSHRFGMLTYICLLSAKGISAEFEASVERFCDEHPSVTILIRTIGSWDFELVLNVESGQEILSLGEDLLEELGNFLQSYRMLPVFAYNKISEYPF
jgi:DNA-binding Lrp family transcriptional regulator